MKLQILGIVLGVLFGVPAVAVGSSFTYSLVQGKTPSEAFSTVGNQIERLLGRVDTLESEQEDLSQRIQELEGEKTTASPRVEESKSEPEPEVIAKTFAPSEDTQKICNAAAEFEVENKSNSLKGNIQLLCDRVLTGKYETQEQYDEVVESLNSKWELLNKMI